MLENACVGAVFMEKNLKKWRFNRLNMYFYPLKTVFYGTFPGSVFLGAAKKLRMVIF